MHITIRQLAPILKVGILAAGLTSSAAFAQAWPTKNVTMVVPFATGGTTDALARAVGQELSKALGQPVIIENRGGAGATLGAEYVSKAKSDGYTLLVGAVHHTIASSVYKNLRYDFEKDFAPITTLAMVPNILVVGPSVDAKSVSELIAAAKSAPGKYSFGSNGNGTGQHLIGAQFEKMAGVQLLHVPYRGSGPLTTDLLGGQVHMSFDTITPVLSHIKAGKLRPLAVTTATRSSVLPDVPTLDESGLKGFDQGTWFGVLAPAATPKDIVSRLNTEIVKIIKAPEFAKKLQEMGAEPVGDTQEQMAAQIKADTERYGKLVKEANISIE